MELSKTTTKRIAYLIILAGVVLTAILHLNDIISFIAYIWKILLPFLVGFAIAFILNIIIEQFEKTLFKNVHKNRRLYSFIFSFILVISIIILISFIVGPELVVSFQRIAKQLPASYQSWINLLKENQHIFGGVFEDTINNLIQSNKDVTTMFTNLKANWQPLFNSGYTLITATISGIYTFFIGFVFSIYLLLSKDKLTRQVRTLATITIGEKRTKQISGFITLAKTTFANFITCQCLEACILGMMFFISMTILQMPYALLLGVIIAITALIPVFGAFIGCFIGILLIGISNPMQAIWFVILFLVLQQIEGNFIYPHVVGNSVGLPSIWVFAAVIIGGNLMGVFGMFLFIPITSILYTLCRQYIRTKTAS